MRAKCLNVEQATDKSKDPEVTAGMFYTVVQSSIQSIASPEPFISIVGNSGEEVQRPKRNFQIFK